VSLAIKYESVEDAKMRLRHTVVLYKDTPVYILDIVKGDGDDILRVQFQEIPLAPGEMVEAAPVRARGADLAGLAQAAKAAAAQRKYISSKHFDIAPFKMGYVNSPKGAFFASRLPHRMQKQGLCSENFTGKTNQAVPIGFMTFLNCKETVAMIKGEYPSFDQAMKALDKSPAVAFDREFCLVKDDCFPELITYLYHKGVKVGMFNKNDGLSLGKKFTCLKEQLGEMKIKVGLA
jgi:hypothetical protein